MVGHVRNIRLSLLSTSRLNVWMIMTILVVLMVMAFAETKPFGSATTIRSTTSPTNFHVHPATGRIHDNFGRERIFHGLNVVVKGGPWHPRVDAFDPQSSFTDEDIALLKEWGMNVVRLGIMWPGVEPSRGYVNSTYLEIMHSIVSKLHSAGIYTLLEFHQDLYASQFCGEGMPSWILDDYDLSLSGRRPLVHVHQKPNPSAQLNLHFDPLDENATNSEEKENYHKKTVTNNPAEHSLETPPSSTSLSSSLTVAAKFLFRGQQGQDSGRKSSQLTNNMVVTSSKMRYPASFPEPLGRRWPWPSEWEKDGWEPPAEQCNSHAWWLFYLSYAVSRAFQDLYDNKWGWGDLLARYWTVVPAAFKDQPGVLGYELMNEPWPGDVFSNPLLFLPGVADKKNLAPFYEKLQAAVRSVDKERILFFETITFDNFRCGWSTVPGGVEWQNKTVLSYHYYTPPNFSAKQAFAQRSRESKRLKCGSMLTEFFVSTEQDTRDQKVFRKARRDILRAAFGTSVLNPKPNSADMEALLCDPPEEGPSEVTCENRRRAVEEDLKITLAEVNEEEIIQYEGDERGGDGEKDLESSQVTPLLPVDEDLQKAKEVDSVDGVLSAADTYVQSWIGWEYKAFFHKTGSIAEQSLFREDGEVDLTLAKKLSRTYPQSVCGNIVSFTFDPPSSLFSLSYVAGRDCMTGDPLAPTEIFVQREFYYPNELLVEVNPPCASFTETDRIVQVTHNSKCFGYVINVRITRLDPVL
ncbi:unnamed protein product [Calypogeia fissa]